MAIFEISEKSENVIFSTPESIIRAKQAVAKQAVMRGLTRVKRNKSEKHPFQGPLKGQKRAENEFMNLCSRVSRYNFKHKVMKN